MMVFSGCTKNDIVELKNNSITATIEGQDLSTRVSIADGNTITWVSGDQISAFVGSTPYTYDNISGDNFSSDDPVPDNAEVAVVAYPSAGSSFEEDVLTVTVPSTIDATSNASKTIVPMIGSWNDGNVAFRHLAGILRVNLNDIPVGYDKMVVTASEPIAGAFTADVTAQTPVMEASASATNSITVSFAASATVDNDRTLYLPLPVGSYESISVAVSNGTATKQLTNWSNKTVERAKIYTANATYVEANNIAGVNTALSQVTNENKNAHVVVDDEISGENIISVPDVTGSSVTLDLQDVADGASITVNSNESASSAPADQTIDINIDNSNSTALTIDAPTATVTIGKGKFSTITATTAQNTLIIGEGVTVGTLTIEDGNVVIDGGTVGSIENQNSKSITYVINSLSEIGEVPNYATAIEIKLTEDINTSEIYVLSSGKEITLNGNGHTLTSSAGRAINVSGTEKATIKNLTINASGERAINIIQNSKEVTIDNVTATAANYTVNVASSAPGAEVTINNSTLDGLNVVNVASEGAVVTVTNSTINCNDNNTTEGESYAALCLNKEAINGKITAAYCTINVTDGSDSQKARNGADGGNVTIDGSADDVSVMVAAITYEGSNYYHSFETLVDAFDYAKSSSNAKISLIRDIELNGEWTPVGTADEPFSGHFDGNNKTISNLTINSGNYAGLFGYVSGGATIEKVTLEDVDVSGGERMAALIGKITGNAVVSNCTVSGSVTGSDSNTGGIIGEIVTGTVQLTELTNNATVTNTKTSNSRAGGIVGQVTTGANVTLNNCINTGDITTVDGYAGGIVSAYQSGTLAIYNCTNSGELTGYYTGNMLGWYTSIRSISISTEANVFDINAIGCVDIAISSKMSLYGKNYFVNRMADLTGVTQTAQTFSDIFAEGKIGESPKALWDKLIAFYNHAAETNANFAGYPKTYWAMFNHTAGYPSDGAWNTYFNSYNANVGEDQKLTQEEFSSASWREKIVYLAPEE